MTIENNEMEIEKVASQPNELLSPNQPPFKVFKQRDFTIMLAGQGVSQLGSMMRLTAIGWQIYVLTGDPLQLGFIGLCRIIPLFFLSFIAGTIVDAVDRRKLLMITEVIFLLCSATLAAVTLAGIANVWWIYSIILISSAASAFEIPCFAALTPALVPRAMLPNALGMQNLVGQLGTVIGPGLAGILIAIIGVQGIYIIDAVSYIAILIALNVIHFRQVKSNTAKISLSAAFEGAQFLMTSKILLSAALLDFFATFFASAVTLLPIFAKDVLHNDAAQLGIADEVAFGLLSAAQPVGAMLASLVLVIFSLNRFRHPGMILLVAVLIFSGFTVLFGYSTSLILSMVCLAGMGASDTVSMVLRETISQLVTPDEMRGRVQSAHMLFFLGGPQLGEVEAGVVARFYGAPFSVISGGYACVFTVLLITFFSRKLRNYQFE